MFSKIENPYTFTDEEKLLIRDNYSVHTDWDKSVFDDVKSNITQHLRNEQNNECCYCRQELGFDIEVVATAFEKMQGVKGRAEVVPTGKDFTVIIDYAHTPDGLSNILSTFKELKIGRLVCLFGCGGDRDAKKRPIMGSIAARLSDYVIVTSDNPRTEDPNLIIKDILEGMKNTKTPYNVIENRIEAIKYAVTNAKTDDIIVLAGKGHETYQILKTGKIHLDEREVIAEALGL